MAVEREREERWEWEEEGTQASRAAGSLEGGEGNKQAAQARRVGPIRCGPAHADRQAGPRGSGAANVGPQPPA